MQFRLRTVLIFVTILCVILATVFTSNKFVYLVAVSVVVANVLGAIAAWIVTHGLKMPTDGSYWREGQHDDFEDENLASDEFASGNSDPNDTA